MKSYARGWMAIVVAAAVCSQTQAQPSQVLIIRHAEKPDDDSIHLSPNGQKRAEALPRLFMKSLDRPVPFPKPDFLFATKMSSHGNRPVETVTPLARALNLDINAWFKDDEFAQLATELLTNPRYAGKTVLVCWHHGTIPKLAEKLKAEDVPDHWKELVFDKVSPSVERHHETRPGEPRHPSATLVIGP
jgi:broad specificity phosphatase PhoE